IVIFAPRAGSAGQISRLSKKIFDQAACHGLHLALAELPSRFFRASAPSINWDQERVTCLRSVMMKPEHLDWLNRIWTILSTAADESRRSA
ncbi:MAG: pyridoxal phosphate-dependent decarboxylase family protein, partial [Terriglobales bacterium]